MNEEEEAVKFDGLILFLPGTSLGGLGWLGAPKDPQDGSCGGSRKVWQLGSARGCVREESCRPHGVISKVDSCVHLPFMTYCRGDAQNSVAVGGPMLHFTGQLFGLRCGSSQALMQPHHFPVHVLKGMGGETLWTTCLAPVPHC